MKYILALDQGTSSSRAVIFDENLSVSAVSQEELSIMYPDSGWVEHDPNAILTSQIRVAQNALQICGTASSDIVAIGIANQRETTIIWNRKTGKPVYNAIVWQDRRTVEACDLIREEGLSEIIKSKPV